jgi:broad specificity phosphatase PhoE
MRHAVAAFLVVLGSVAALPAGSEDPAATSAPTFVAPGSSDPGVDQTPPASDVGGQVVFLIRHAERADAGMASAKTPGADPDLSEAGKARAKRLVALLKDAKITSIFVTEYKRTRDTGQPLADAIGIPTVTINASDSRLHQTLRVSPGNVLVVGHSNTLPDTIKSLGISEPVTIAEDDFGSVFVVFKGAKPSLVRLHY